jgi:transcriptional regulator with XRE-family HTH domain
MKNKSDKKSDKKVKVKEQKKEPKKVTKLKIFLMERNINQKELAEKTELSTNTINSIVSNGNASRSVIKLLSYELNIPVAQLMDLLQFIEPTITQIPVYSNPNSFSVSEATELANILKDVKKVKKVNVKKVDAVKKAKKIKAVKK